MLRDSGAGESLENVSFVPVTQKGRISHNDKAVIGPTHLFIKTGDRVFRITSILWIARFCLTMALTVHYLWSPSSTRPAILSGEDCSYVLFSSVAYKPVFPQSDALAGIGIGSAAGVCGFCVRRGRESNPQVLWGHDDL